MAFRSVLISKATKINLDLNNIVVYYEEEKFYINLDEISIILIEDPRCLVSLRLLTELGEKGISLILTNASHVPIASLESLNGNSRAPKRYKSQIAWQKETKEYLWTEIVKQKIKLQIKNLENHDKINKLEIMKEYLNDINFNDKTNREGLSSRTYFKELFGGNFKRFNEDIINFCLNYSYQIIRAKISQEIVALGYNPCLGINHTSEYNSFNLADDFIEVYRPIVDNYVYELLNNSSDDYLTPNLKQELVNVVNKKILYDGYEQKIHLSISLYLQNMFNFLNEGEITRIKFPEFI